MKRVFLFILFACCVGIAHAQNVSNVAFYQEGKTIVVTYSLDRPADIILQVSTDGGNTFSNPLQKTSGHVGKDVDAGNNTILWNVLDELENLKGDNLVFLVTAITNDATNSPQLSKGTAHAGHYYVDLGLFSGTLWATYNVGATAPEEYGDYFAWGETESKSNYDWNTYKWCTGEWALSSDSKSITKYCMYSKKTKKDKKNQLELADDAAYVNWGSEWRMPTQVEIQELVEECQWIWTTIHDVRGYQIIGPNNNSIFLPAAGHKLSNFTYENEGGYWSSSLYKRDKSTAGSLNFTWSGINEIFSSDSRHIGNSVRPVACHSRANHIPKSNNPSSQQSTSNITADSLMRLFFPVYGIELGNITTTDLQAKGYKVKKYSYGSSCDVKDLNFYDDNKDGIFEKIYITYSDNMPTFWIINTGLTWELSYNQITSKFKELGFSIKVIEHPQIRLDSGRLTLSAKIKAISPDGKLVFTFQFDYGNDYGEGCSRDSQNSLYSITIETSVIKKSISTLSTGIAHAGHYYVDLGLPSGTLWATYNVGASALGEYGKYFSWGETESKSNYDWNTYQWCSGDKLISNNPESLIKYCTDRKDGMVDMTKMLELSDDAAYVNWGQEWRMPTSKEIQELFKKCKWAWITLRERNISGYIVIGPNNNNIFLPAAGWCSGNTWYNANMDGLYWSSSLWSGDEGSKSKYAGTIYTKQIEKGHAGTFRKIGCPIRPVVYHSHAVHNAYVDSYISSQNSTNNTVQKSLIHLFSPVYGFELGRVTTRDFQAKGYEVKTIESEAHNCDVQGLDFWDRNKDNIFEDIYMTRSAEMPIVWTQTVGLTWSLSYNEIISKFKELGFLIEITESPKIEHIYNRNTLSARVEAISPDKSLSFTFNFDYGNENGEGYSQDSPNSLFSISIDTN